MTDSNSPLMEIHLCTFNGSSTLIKTLESIVPQLSPSIVLAVLDDSSTDNSRDIIYHALAAVPIELYRIVCLDNNKGLAHAKNVLAKTSAAQYLAYIDDDDICTRDRFSLQLDTLLDNPAIDVLGGFAYQMSSFDMDGHDSLDLSKSRLIKRPTSHQSIVNCLWRNPFIHPTVAIKRSTLLSVGGYNSDLRTSQDYDLWFRLNEQNALFRNLDIPLIIYRRSSAKKYKPISYIRTLRIARSFLSNRGLVSTCQLCIMTLRVYYKVAACFFYNISSS